MAGVYLTHNCCAINGWSFWRWRVGKNEIVSVGSRRFTAGWQ